MIGINAMRLAYLLNLNSPVVVVGYTFNNDVVSKLEYQKGHFIIYCRGCK